MKGIDAFDRRYSLTGYLLLLVIFLPALVFAILNTYNMVPAFLNNTEALKQTGLSFLRALAVGFAALLLAFPGVVIYAKCSNEIRNLLRVNFAFSFCFPAALMEVCFDNLFSSGGFIANLQLSPVIRTSLVNLMLNIPLLIVMLGEHLRHLDVRQKMCARSIKSPAISSFMALTLPRLVPALLGAFALVLMRCMTPTGNTVVSMLFSVLFLIVLVSTDKKRSQAEVSLDSLSEPKAEKKSVFITILSVIYMVAAQCLVIIPFISMILRSILIDGSVSFEAYRLLFSSSDYLTSLGFCLAIAVVSSVIASVLGIHISVGIANTGCSLFLALLPFAIGPATLAFGFTGLYPWVGQTQTVKLLFTLLCHILVLTPVQVMIILPAVRALSANLRKTSVSLGNTSSQSFRLIELRILDIDVRCAFFTSVALSIGLWAEGEWSEAYAFGSVILILCFIFFFMGIGHTREGKRNV